MLNRRMFSIVINLLLFSMCLFNEGECQAGSIMEWHKIVNKTEEDVFVTLFEGYPLNHVHSKMLKPGQILEVKEEVERPGYFYTISVTKNYKKDKEIVCRKLLSWWEYTQLYTRASNTGDVDGFHITEERLQTWDHDPK